MEPINASKILVSHFRHFSRTMMRSNIKCIQSNSWLTGIILTLHKLLFLPAKLVFPAIKILVPLHHFTVRNEHRRLSSTADKSNGTSICSPTMWWSLHRTGPNTCLPGTNYKQRLKRCDRLAQKLHNFLHWRLAAQLVLIADGWAWQMKKAWAPIMEWRCTSIGRHPRRWRMFSKCWLKLNRLLRHSNHDHTGRRFLRSIQQAIFRCTKNGRHSKNLLLNLIPTDDFETSFWAKKFLLDLLMFI